MKAEVLYGKRGPHRVTVSPLLTVSSVGPWAPTQGACVRHLCGGFVPLAPLHALLHCFYIPAPLPTAVSAFSCLNMWQTRPWFSHQTPGA